MAGWQERARAWLLARAEADPRITGAAVTGSAARGESDAWSDVDVYLGVTAPVSEVLADWSDRVYAELGAVHHFDLTAGRAVYRAFLLPGLGEVDLGLCPATEWGPRGGAFDVVLGEPAPSETVPPPDPDHLAGLAWHHARHGQVCLERGRLWQAEHWVSALRDLVLALAAARRGLDASYARGAHLLPDSVTAPLAGALVGELAPEAIRTALAVALSCFLGELAAVDEPLADVLAAEMKTISG